MDMRQQASKYSTIAIAIHWLMAGVVFALIAIGWFMVDLPPGPDRSHYFALHKSLGLTAFLLLLLRVGWRWGHRPPELPGTIPLWQRGLAHVVHLAFYALLIMQPLSGYLSSSFSGYKTRLFGMPLPHWGWRDAPLNEFFTEIHVMCSIALVVLIAVHLLGALTHVLTGESALLRRILPW